MHFDVCRPPSLNCLNPYFQACADVSFVSTSFSVDMSLEEVSPEGVHLVLRNGNPSSTPMINQGNGVWKVDLLLLKGSEVNYKFRNGLSISGLENIPQDCAVGNQLVGFWREYIVPTTSSEVGLVCFGYCIQCPHVHTITFNAGWNSVSSFLLPVNSNIETIFGELSNDLIILQNLAGFYYPDGGVNTIGNWSPQSAYQLKVDQNTSLTIVGFPEEDKSFQLNAGWNLVPVISDQPVDITLLLGNIIESVVMVKSASGLQLYWPEYNINTLGMMQPGNAYLIKMLQPASITFP